MFDKAMMTFDICPYTWKNCGPITDALLPAEKTIYILTQRGRILNIFHPDRGLCDLPVDLTNYEKSANDLLRQSDGVECVLFIEREALPQFLTLINQVDVRDMDTTEYTALIYRTFYTLEGVKDFRKKPFHWDFHEKLGVLLKEHCQGDSTLGYAIFDGDTLFFDAILGIVSGQIQSITSFDYLFHDEILTRRDELRMRAAFEKMYSDSGQLHFFEKDEFFSTIEHLKEAL